MRQLTLFPKKKKQTQSFEQGRVTRALRSVGLFAGIGGIELGLHQAGHSTELICEIDNLRTGSAFRPVPGNSARE